jgi:tRNA dimethylallyltransferase
MEEKKQKLIVVLGPTASGKTDLGISLAKEFNGEVVSADSRLVYTGMDIGTAKPEKDKNHKDCYCVDGIRHHLIDIYPLSERYNVALFKEDATKVIKDISLRGKTPFLVGGTGLYIDAITKNLDFPKIIGDESLRSRLEEKDTETLFKEYQELDPVGSSEIDSKNRRRLIRAIEVCKTTGVSFWENRRLEKPVFDCLKIGIGLEKEILLANITRRVEKMLSMGLEKEAVSLLREYSNTPPLQTIGYREWLPYIDKSPIAKEDLSQIKERIVINTFKFAKRQLTWFKRDKDIHWIKDKNEVDEYIKEFLI